MARVSIYYVQQNHTGITLLNYLSLNLTDIIRQFAHDVEYDGDVVYLVCNYP